MIRYILKKIRQSVFILLGVITLIFILFNVIPADPARMIAGQHATTETLENIREELGLNKSPFARYFHYLNDVLPISLHSKNSESFYFYESTRYGGTQIISAAKWCLVVKWPYLGESFQSQRDVRTVISQTFPNTLILAFSSIILASVLGIILGLLAAVFKDSLYDRFSLFVSAIGMSVPSFFAAIIIGWFFAIVLGKYTNLNLTGNLYEIDDLGRGKFLALKNLILPSITLGIRPLAIVLQLTRNSLLDTLDQDYIRTAKAKGLSFFRVLYSHALRNALNPVITAISGWFASLMAGVIFVEYIFGWKGLGTVIVNSLNNQDTPLVTGCILTIALLFIIVNILVDILYSVLDPRIKQYEKN
ncbi:MAG: ABC transporter permease [Bacteroidales bacterium]|nr:ABC transporter permease [Bacteroidales bacterium]